MEFVSLQDLVQKLGIKTGAQLLISSDIKRLMFQDMQKCRIEKRKFKPEHLIDVLLEAVGPTGTIVFPTYNWDFCRGKGFDIKNSPCEVGGLNALALRRTDFKRTRHAIYSFAVAGFYQDQMVALDNRDSFADDSPFAFMYRHNFKNIMIDVNLTHCFTFAHYPEQMSDKYHNYRYIKNFTGDYIDENGVKTQRTYSMNVRQLDKNVVNQSEVLAPTFIERGAMTETKYGDSSIRVLDLKKVYDLVIEEMINHDGQGLSRHDI
ncbi:MAG: AAC(3) family N-acetyltransferase [Succinatimonas sp.]|nr:AAC(3) family N-acetyltransferase [Succinatimonas sp.]